MNIVIAGGGAAAFEAAFAARKNCADCNIEIHSAESVPPYRRPALPGLICADEAEFAKMFIRKDEFYRENNIKLHLNSRMTSIDTAKKQVTFNGDQICSYDKLILATGGKAFVPPFPGADSGNGLVLRSFEDLKTLRAKLASGAQKIAVVGGGILGLELADSLLKCGKKVTILERSECLLKRNVSFEDAEMMRKKLADINGFKLICNAAVRSITQEGVELESGALIPADLVIFSTGSRPELAGLAPEITVERAIVVNNRMETSVPDIFACGDNSQFDGSVCGLYTTARAMAITAGTNAAGGNAEYVPKQNTITLNVLGFKMGSDGKVTVK